MPRHEQERTPHPRRPYLLVGRDQRRLLPDGALQAALQDVDTAFYLVHSMGSSESFEDADRTAAENFARAAREAGCRDLVLLKCTSTYPASPENTNILTIPDLREKFGY